MRPGHTITSMPVFLVIPLSKETAPLNAAVQSMLEEHSRHPLVNDRGWLVTYNGTSKELTNHLGITGQADGDKSPIGPAIVAPISSYYGRGPNDMWEWLSLKFGA